MNQNKRFRQAALYLIPYTLLVILWGAWVRISHSGNGCGETWPLCQGNLIPQAATQKTWVELSHRLMSGAFGIYILIIFLWGRKIMTEKFTRIFLYASFILMITEALLGAKLVVSGLVGTNDSPFRAFAMALHLVNSLALVGAIVLVFDFSSSAKWAKQQNVVRSAKKMMWVCLLGFGLLSITGAIAALSTTLFPSSSILSGMEDDVSATAHYLVRLRGLHPLLGVLIGCGIAIMGWIFLNVIDSKDRILLRRTQGLTLVTAIAVMVGSVTLMMLSPIVLKFTHLTMTYLVWISLVLWTRALLWIKN